MFKSERGITLVALVITIIILLILAGITLVLALDDNGMLRQANATKVVQIETEVKEQMQFAILSAKAQMSYDISARPGKVFTQKEIAEYIEESLTSANGDVYEVTPDNDSPATGTTFTITYTGARYDSAADEAGLKITRTCTVTTYNLKDNNDTTSTYDKRTREVATTPVAI